MRDAFYAQLLASSPTQAGFNESNQETINSNGLSSTPDEGFDTEDDDRRSTHNDNVTDVGEIDDSHDCVTEFTSTSDTDDSDMAKQIDAAGEGESLLGSDSSDDDERLAKEEEYLIQEVIQGSHNRDERFDNSAGKVSDINNEDNPREHNEFWNSLSPNVRIQENGVLGEEMFKPQRGFASSPEPSFSDFFVSSDEMDGQHTEDDCDDDEMLTTDEDSMSGSESDSSISNASLSTPLLAHFGAAQTDGHQNDTLYDTGELDEDGSLKSAIPLLVIEDLDGRLIYARAGDGEAVFGSDGEFEFAEESEDESSSDEFSDIAQTHSYNADNKTGADTTMSNTEHSSVDTLDGDTTDELPDEDMPYPRLLVGSVAPKGGKNARRAREIAARCRLLSPRPASSVLASAGRSTFSRVPSALSMTSKIADDQTDVSSESPEPVGNAKETAAGVRPLQDAKAREGNFVKPEMGEFMPAMSKSVRRAVIDGSHRAPSPFIDRHRLQHALGRKRQGKGDAEDSLEHALQGPRRMKRKRAQTPNYFHAPTSRGPSADLTSQNLSSNPESMDQGSVMDLCDVLDENLLWQEVDSQEPSCDNDDPGEFVSRDTHANAKQRSRSRSQPSVQEGGGLGLNYNAFARWNRIPMAAFRDSQKQAGGMTSPALPSSAYTASQNSPNAYLLMHSLHTDRKHYLSNPMRTPSRIRKQKTPFRRGSGSLHDQQIADSPLQRTLADSTLSSGDNRQVGTISSLSSLPDFDARKQDTGSQTSAKFGDHTVVGGRFLVSPMLRPVKHIGRKQSTGNLGAPSSSDPLPKVDYTAPLSGAHVRKVTKKEKREKLARRAALKRPSMDRPDRLGDSISSPHIAP